MLRLRQFGGLILLMACSGPVTDKDDPSTDTDSTTTTDDTVT
jgi:hypothetical protein